MLNDEPLPHPPPPASPRRAEEEARGSAARLEAELRGLRDTAGGRLRDMAETCAAMEARLAVAREEAEMTASKVGTLEEALQLLHVCVYNYRYI